MLFSCSLALPYITIHYITLQYITFISESGVTLIVMIRHCWFLSLIKDDEISFRLNLTKQLSASSSDSQCTYKARQC